MSQFTENFSFVWSHKHGQQPSWHGDSLTDIFARLPSEVGNAGGTPDRVYGLRGCLLLMNDSEWRQLHMLAANKGSHQLQRMVCGPDSDADNVLAEIYDQTARAELDVLKDARFTPQYKDAVMKEARQDARAQVEALGSKLLSEATAAYDAAKRAYAQAYGQWRAQWDVGAQLVAVQTAGPLAAAHPVEISAAINEAAQEGNYHALKAIDTLVVPSLVQRTKISQEKDLYNRHDLVVDMKQRLAAEMAAMEPDELRTLNGEMMQAQAAREKVQAQIDSVKARYQFFK